MKLLLVKRIVNTINFDDFGDQLKHFYRLINKEGAERVYQTLNTAARSNINVKANLRNAITHFGQVIIGRMTEEEKCQYLPYNDIRVEPFGIWIRITFSSLRKVTISGKQYIHKSKARGTMEPCYYSPHCPTIKVNGEERIVAFTQHAIEQTCKRIEPHWKTYAGLGDVHAFFADCLYFERCELAEMQPAFTFFQDCFLNLYDHQILNFANEYKLRIIGCYPDTMNWYYRVGYCPAYVKDKFFIGTTLLFPGYSKTPEYKALFESDLSRAEKELKKKLAQQQTAEYLRDTFDFGLVKWFHDNGIPQVVSLTGDVFWSPNRQTKREVERLSNKG